MLYIEKLKKSLIIFEVISWMKKMFLNRSFFQIAKDNLQLVPIGKKYCFSLKIIKRVLITPIEWSEPSLLNFLSNNLGSLHRYVVYVNMIKNKLSIYIKKWPPYLVLQDMGSRRKVILNVCNLWIVPVHDPGWEV